MAEGVSKIFILGGDEPAMTPVLNGIEAFF
jgi:hypothetical protein